MTVERCDLCYAELKYPVYVYETPSTGTLEQAERGEAYWAEDPQWGVCQDCHEIVSCVDAGQMTVLTATTVLTLKTVTHAGYVRLDAPASAHLSLPGQLAAHRAAATIRAFFENKSSGWLMETG